jgi:hexosaminidase
MPHPLERARTEPGSLSGPATRWRRAFGATLATLTTIALQAGCASSSPARAAAEPLPLIPLPASVERAAGSFAVDASVSIVAPHDAPMPWIAEYFAGLVARSSGLKLQAAASGARAGREIAFVLATGDAASIPPEGYVLDISPERASITAATAQGAFYGAITLWQLITSADPGAAPVRIPAMRIVDAPRFQWRGFMLDVARHYMPPEFVKQVLDWMAIHKLNTFHWHLTDDQGWRLEIRKYPLLTEIGAWRIPAGAAGAGGRYGGFYTQEEVRDIVRHAAERFITVVPEIDMPGHAQAAIAAYPQLGTEDARPPVSADWGVHSWLYNVEESTFTFLEDVLGEVMELFPGPYIHVGGDEAVKDRWIASPRVQQRMRELGIADETALQSWFIGRIERTVRGSGRKLIGWDEILEGGLAAEAAVMSWRGEQGAIAAATHGHDVVMTTHPTLYLDFLQSDASTEPPGRPTYVTLADVYAFEPVPAVLGGEQARHILGAQLNAWTEHMRTPERILHNALPRAAALAEVTWSPRESRDWHGFLARLAPQMWRYEALGVRHAGSAFEPRFEVRRQDEAVHVRLTNQSAYGRIHYTLDGSEPSARSSEYREPLRLELPARLRAATFVAGRRIGPMREQLIDRRTLLRRTDDELRPCARNLLLRLEDDAPLAGERAVFNVDIMDPCWLYEDADLGVARGLAVTVGQLPFNFQIGRDVEKIPLRPPQTPHGELEVLLDGCGGERLALLPLAPAVDRAALTELPAVALDARVAGVHDLCFRFTRRTLEPMWVIDAVQLLE